jgi:hypothetical protein
VVGRPIVLKALSAAGCGTIQTILLGIPYWMLIAAAFYQSRILYRTVSLTPAGRNVDETMPLLFVMKDAGRPVPKRKRKKNSSKSKASPRATART